MPTKGPLHTPVTLGSVVGGATWGLRNGFDVAPRRARAPRAWPRAWPFPVTARFGHPLLENRVPGQVFWMLSFGKSGGQLCPAARPGAMSVCGVSMECYASIMDSLTKCK